MRAHPRLVSTGYFQTMGIPLVRGREFTDHDADASDDVVVVNEAAARRYWPNEDPIGQRISLGAEADWREIVGVVGDTRHEGLDADADPAAFLPQHQPFLSLGAGFARAVTLVDSRQRGRRVGRVVAARRPSPSVDPQVPIGLVRPMDDSSATRSRRAASISCSCRVFAGVALVLTAAGLYGVMA